MTIDEIRPNGFPLLQIAAHEGKEDIVNWLLDHGVNVNLRFPNDKPRLTLGCVQGYQDVVSVLSECHQSQSGGKDFEGETALHVAVQRRSEKMVKLLLKRRARVNVRNLDGNMALHVAAAKGHRGIVNFLVENGAMVTMRNDKYETPLYKAVERGFEQVVKLLVESEPIKFDSSVSRDRVLLHRAVETGNINIVKILLEQHGVDVNTVDDSEGTALCAAAAAGNEDIVRMLVDHGAAELGVATRDDGITPLHRACEKGHAGVVKIFIESGRRDINALTYSSKETALHLAVRQAKSEEIVKLLIEGGADVNITDCGGNTALHWAVEGEIDGIVKLLIESAAKLNVENEEGKTTLCIAAEKGHERYVKYLVDRGASFDDINKYERTLLHYAAMGQCEEVVKFFIELGIDVNAKSSLGETALHLAAVGGNTNAKIVKTLIQSGAQVNANSYYVTVLDKATRERYREMLNSLVEIDVEHNRVECIELLTSYSHYSEGSKKAEGISNRLIQIKQMGAKFNFEVVRGETPLHLAVAGANKEVVEMLIDQGAQVNGQSWCGSVLKKAAQGGNEEIIKLLVRRGVEADKKSLDDETLLHWAAWSGSEAAVKIFLELGADINLANHHGNTVLYEAIHGGNENIVRTLVDLGVDLNVKNKSDETALLAASEKNHFEIVKLLLDRGATVDSPRDNGETAFTLAAAEGNLEIVKLLLERGADVNSDGSIAGPALHSAIKSRNEELVKLLIERGAKIEGKDYYWNLTPLAVACQRSTKRILSMLIKAGANVNTVDRLDRKIIHSVLGHANFVKILLQNGATVDSEKTLICAIENRCNNHNENAMSDSYFEKLMVNPSRRTMEVLLDDEMLNVDIKDSGGLSALSIIAVDSRPVALQLLLDYQANVSDTCAGSESLICRAGRFYSSRVIISQKMITRHIAKMQFANLFVSKAILQDIENICELRAFKVECEREIGKMDNISETFDFGKLLLWNHRDLSCFKDYSQEARILHQHKKDFPIYHGVLYNQLRRRIWRKLLLDQVKHFFKAVAEAEGNESLPKLTNDCVDKIFSDLTNKDLKTLIKVCDPYNDFELYLCDIE